LGTDDLTQTSARDLATLIRAKEVSSLEVVEAHLQRIEDVNPRLNAVVQLAAERALDDARAADAALIRGENVGQLHGVPFTVKDWIETEGLICAAGHASRADFVPMRDATVVARMRAAGGILLGKTNVVVTNEVYGRTNNPYDFERTPGGSTSGEAAIIAAGGSTLGLGSDSGGSIRQPAAYCGIAGLKPTNGRVPNTGHFPPISSMNDPRTQIGPLARYVDDLSLALAVITGVDWRDASVVPMPLGGPEAVDLASLRVAYYTGYEGAVADADTVAAVRSAAGALSGVCASVAETMPERMDEAMAITRAYWRRAGWLGIERPDAMGGDEVERSLFEWDRLKRAVLRFFEHVDAIICPVTPAPAPLHDDRDDPTQSYVFTVPYSLTGQPCVALRVGTSSDGLPIGVQVVARQWRDDVALAVAQHLEEVFGGWQAPDLQSRAHAIEPAALLLFLAANG